MACSRVNFTFTFYPFNSRVWGEVPEPVWKFCMTPLSVHYTDYTLHRLPYIVFNIFLRLRSWRINTSRSFPQSDIQKGRSLLLTIQRKYTHWKVRCAWLDPVFYVGLTTFLTSHFVSITHSSFSRNIQNFISLSWFTPRPRAISITDTYAAEHFTKMRAGLKERHL